MEADREPDWFVFARVFTHVMANVTMPLHLKLQNMERIALCLYGTLINCTFINRLENIMSGHTYKIIELVGTSTTGTDDAINSAISKAGKTLKHLDWFEVVETRGHIVDNKIAHYQVVLKVGFRIED